MAKRVPTKVRTMRVPMLVIRRLAREIAKRFDPDRVILFGSHARGDAGPDSDVDLLVVMNAPNEINQSIRITLAMPDEFPLDIIVRTPDRLRERLELGDWFLRTVMEEGIVLHEKPHRTVGPKSGSRSRRRNPIVPPQTAAH